MAQYYSVDVRPETFFVHTEDIEQPHLEEALKDAGGNLAPAAVGHAVAGPKRAYVYRKMAEAEFLETIEQGGMLYPKAKNPKNAEKIAKTGEKWFTESLQHTRKFDNKNVAEGTKEVIAEFELHKPGYQDIKTNHTIPQAGSKKLQPAEGRQFNVTNNELLKNHPKGKVNIGLKGRINVDEFNKHVISVKKINPDSFFNKTSALRWLRRNKLSAAAGAIGVLLDAGALILSVIEDNGKFGPSTKVTLAEIGGGAVGGYIGAAIGSLLPGIGTFVCGFIGSFIGSLIGNGIMSFFLGYSPAVPGPGLPAAEWETPSHEIPQAEWNSSSTHGVNPPIKPEWNTSVNPPSGEWSTQPTGFPTAEWDNIPGTSFPQPAWNIQQ